MGVVEEEESCNCELYEWLWWWLLMYAVSFVRLLEGEWDEEDEEEAEGEGSKAFVEHITLFCRLPPDGEEVEEDDEGEWAAVLRLKWGGNCGVIVTCGLGTMDTEPIPPPPPAVELIATLAGEMGGEMKGTNVLEELVCIKVERSGFDNTFCTTALISSFILNFFSKSSKAADEFKGTVLLLLTAPTEEDVAERCWVALR